MDIGKRVKIARIATGQTTTDFAMAAEISRQYLSMIESGRRTPSLKTLRKLAFALGCPVSFLISETPLW